MKFLYVLAAIVAATAALEFRIHPEFIEDSYPEWYIRGHRVDLGRTRRDVTLDKQIGNGRVFGTVGQNDAGLFGKGGYEHNVFNDHRGRLDASAYGTRVLSPNGDSSHLGGGLAWKNNNAAASMDITRQIHGPSSFNAAAGGRWPIGKNGDFTAQGTYGKTSGMRHDFGGRANFNYRF